MSPSFSPFKKNGPFRPQKRQIRKKAQDQLEALHLLVVALVDLGMGAIGL